MKSLQRLILITFILITIHITTPSAAAHPLGNFTINHFAGLQVSRDAIAIDYVLDMAEIPAFQEITAFDTNDNGQADAGEMAGYHPTQCEALRSHLSLRVDGKPVTLGLDSSAIEFPPGAGGLPTLRLTCAFRAPVTLAGENVRIEFKDNSYAGRLGWREIVVTADGVSLQGDFASTSISNRLIAYPDDLLSSPLDQRTVSFNVAPTTSRNQPPTQPAIQQPGEVVGSRNDAFTQLITLQNLTLPTLLLALSVAFVWGAMHALSPGHGKTVIGAYLVGSRGTARHALFLGLTTTITHTAGVFALGLVTLFASRFIVPEQLYPWLSFLSGLLVVGIGLNLFVSRLRSAGLVQTLKVSETFRVSPTHDHEHHHHHHHDHDHAKVSETFRVSPTHDHEHHHHDHHDHDHAHDHHHHHHDHLPPGVDGSPVTWRSLLALGISGGLLPCPSALVVLLSAIALERIGFGLVLVLVFSLGLAGVLTAIGLVFVYAGRLFERAPSHNRVMRLLPVVSALFITLAGLGITARALLETGLI